MGKEVPTLSPEQIQRAVDIFRYYGQGTAELPKELQ